MPIKHLVITGGGGHALFKTLGAYQHLVNSKLIDVDKIESIWGTSAGCIVGILICLKLDWSLINSYLIDRPWNELFVININNIYDLYNKKGLFGQEILKNIFKPLFAINDLSLSITLKEFYDYSNIELHFSTFEINNYDLTDISYLSHPDLTLLTALQMSCGIPVLMSPICIDNKIFIDGGIKSGYSIESCLKKIKDADEVLGFKNFYNNTSITVPSDSNFIDYIISFILKIIHSIGTVQTPEIKYELLIPAEYLNFDMLKNCSESKALREKLFSEGKELGTLFQNSI